MGIRFRRIWIQIHHRLEGYVTHVNLGVDKQHCPETQLDLAIRGNEEGFSQVELERCLARMDKKRLP
jgi:hypothetical protein